MHAYAAHEKVRPQLVRNFRPRAYLRIPKYGTCVRSNRDLGPSQVAGDHTPAVPVPSLRGVYAYVLQAAAWLRPRST